MYPFVDAGATLRHLGVLLTKGDARAAGAAAWQKLVAAVAARVRHWRGVPLTVFGRAYMAKQLMASVITHLATFIEPPPAQLTALQNLIDAYVLFFLNETVTLSRREGAPRDARCKACEGGREP
jgi:hypothetical protein